MSVDRAALAGVLVAAAALALATSAPPGRRTALGVGSPPRVDRERPGASRRVSWLGAGVLAWLALVSAHRLGLGQWSGPVPMALAAAASVVLARRAQRRRRRDASVQMAAAVAEAVSVLAADLSVGRSPPQALADLVADLGSTDDVTGHRLAARLRPVAEAGTLGGSVPAALRAVATTDGCADLARLASAWEVAESLGAPIASVLDRVTTSLRLGADHRRAVRAELAGPRASARLLALLPVLGILMGTGLGARPLHVLLETAYGQTALVVGVALELVGLAWTDRLAEAAEGS